MDSDQLTKKILKYELLCALASWREIIGGFTTSFLEGGEKDMRSVFPRLNLFFIIAFDRAPPSVE